MYNSKSRSSWSFAGLPSECCANCLGAECETACLFNDGLIHWQRLPINFDNVLHHDIVAIVQLVFSGVPSQDQFCVRAHPAFTNQVDNPFLAFLG